MNISFEKLRFKELSNWSISHLLANQFNYNKDYKLERIGNFLIRNKTQVVIEDDVVYKRVTIRLYNKGIHLRDVEIGKKIGTKKQFLVKKGQFLMSKIDARNGAFGIATEEVDEAIITADFFAYDVDESKIIPQFLVLLTTTQQFQKFAQSCSSGTTGRQRIDEKSFLDVKIPLPTLKEQEKIIDEYNRNIEKIGSLRYKINYYLLKKERLVFHQLGISKSSSSYVDNSIFTTVKYSTLDSWGVNKVLADTIFESSFFSLKKIGDYCQLIRGVTYSKKSESLKGYKVLRANNINLDNSLNLEDIKYISTSENFSDEKKLKKNDIFICLSSGSKKHIGKSVFISEDTDFYFGGFMGAIRIIEPSLNPAYLNAILNTSIFNDYLSSKIFGANINNLNSNLLYDFRIPIPNLNQQIALVSKMNDLDLKIDLLKEEVNNSEREIIANFEKKIFNL